MTFFSKKRQFRFRNRKLHFCENFFENLVKFLDKKFYNHSWNIDVDSTSGGLDSLVSDNGDLIWLKSWFNDWDELMSGTSWWLVHETSSDHGERMVEGTWLVSDIFRIEEDYINQNILILSISGDGMNKFDLKIFFRILKIFQNIFRFSKKKFRFFEKKNFRFFKKIFDLIFRHYECYHCVA